MKYDVLGIGNAIVDVLCYVSEAFLKENNIGKGTMELIDIARAEEIYARFGQTTEVSGGCAGNTAAAVASLGGHAAFIGRVKNDVMGRIFAHDLIGTGVFYNSRFAREGSATARSYVMVTPDAERSMLTYLGACTELDESYIDVDLVKDSEITYAEGYLYYQDKARDAVKKAFAHANKTAFSLSDPLCVEHNHSYFMEIVRDTDIVFCNEVEASALYQTTEVKDIVANFSRLGNICVMTRGKKGALVVQGDFVGEVEGEKVLKVLDTTGAGDLFAAGFLHAYIKGKPLTECARLGNKAAAQIIQQLGARPLKPLRETLVA